MNVPTKAQMKMYLFIAKRFPKAVAVTAQFIQEATLAQWKLKQVYMIMELLESAERRARKEAGDLPITSLKYAHLLGQADAHKSMLGLLRDRLAGKNWVEIIQSRRDKR